MATPATPPKGGGNFLTRKMGPLPTWAWAAIGVGGFILYKKWAAAKAASAASSTTSTAATSPLSSGAVSAGSGYGYQGPGFGLGSGGPIPTGATAATSTAAWTPPTNETVLGGGYLPNSAVSGSEARVQDSSGNTYSYIQSPAQLTSLQQGGGSVYVQPTPGQFVPVSNIGSLAPNTPLFTLSQPAAA